MHEGEAHYVLFIAASPERIWTALTDGAMTRLWAFGRVVHSDFAAGSPVRHTLPDGTVEASGSVIEIDPPRLLRVSLTAARDGASAFVTSYEITEFGGMCRLVITEDHQGPGAAARVAAAMRFWPILASALKSLLETGAVPEIDILRLAEDED
jgi:uncharacterized protein YndB with AHSA1/START domain